MPSNIVKARSVQREHTTLAQCEQSWTTTNIAAGASNLINDNDIDKRDIEGNKGSLPVDNDNNNNNNNNKDNTQDNDMAVSDMISEEEMPEHLSSSLHLQIEFKGLQFN